MKDYIKDGLMMRKGPLLIYDDIVKALKDSTLTEAERKELEKQLKKAEEMVDKTAKVFGRFHIEKEKPKIMWKQKDKTTQKPKVSSDIVYLTLRKGTFEMKNPIDLEDLKDIVIDLEAIEGLLVHLEASGYFVDGQDGLTFRAVRNSLEHTREKLENIMSEEENQEKQ